MLDRLAVLVLAVAIPGSVRPPADTLPLPEPSGPLVFEPGTKELILHDLLQSFAQLTGQELAMGPMDMQVLHQAREFLESTEPVPPAEVYAFVEGLLARNDTVIAPITGGTRPILGVYVLNNSRGGTNPVPMLVTLEQLSALSAHPALLVRLLFTFQHTDARQVQTQLRQLTVDNTNITQIVPVGEVALILQGRARDVAGLVPLLQAADEHAGRVQLPRQPQPAAEGPK